ncbi:MAG TPA: hypothetical protein VNO55_06825 [Polyangia bacterium]|nr:hypothetical protein [Polyangia bacterium]
MTGRRGLRWMLLGLGALAGCGGGGAPCVPEGKSIAVSRMNGAGPCPAGVVAGVTSLNGNETFTPMKGVSCGVIHLKLTVTFFSQDASHASCMGTDAIAFTDFQATGGSGTDTMDITCADGTTCTETFDATLTPQ